MSTMSDPLRLADEIISNLKSAATTTAETIRSLQTLLGLENEPTTANSKNPNDVTASNASTRTAARTTTKRSKKVQSFEIYESAQAVATPLNPDSKRKLATEVFNASLKSLTHAVKAKQERDLETGTLSRRPPPSENIPRSVPLQQCSPNRKSKPARPICKKNTQREDIEYVAECATVALTCLRSFDTKNSNSQTAAGEKLQQGALVLAEKLISLGAADQATTVLRNIHEQCYKIGSGSSSGVARGSQPSSETLSAPLLVDHPTLDGHTSSLEFACSYQSQVLRLNILSGSRAVTDHFVTNVSIESSGSPASVVLRGLSATIINEEKAGQYLRTIAQALMRLFSATISNKPAREDRHCTNLQLLVEALRIKSKFWQLSHHTPHLDREFWTPISKGIRRLDTKRDDRDQDTYTFVAEQVRNLRSTLLQNGFDASLPTALAHLMVDMAERYCCFSEGLKILRGCLKTCSRHDTPTQAVLSWRIVILHLQESKKIDEILKPCLNDALKFLSALEGPSFEQTSMILLYGARLRKIAVRIIRDIVKGSENHRVCSDGLDLYSICIDLISRLLSLFSSIAIQARMDIAGEVQQLSSTAFAKTFEAILDMVDFHGTQQTHSPTELDRTIQRGIDNSHRLLTTEQNDGCGSQVDDFIRNLLTRASHLSWNKYLELSSQGACHSDTLHFLKQSCAATAGLPSTIQKTAAFGMKLEKLAIAYLSVKQHDLARRSFEEAIDYYLACGALATSSISPGSSRATWSSRGTQAYLLGKALSSRTRLCLTYDLSSGPTQNFIYDNSSLDTTQRALITEVQMYVTVDHSFTNEQSFALEQHLRAILRDCIDPTLKVYRLRLISRLLYTLARNPTLIFNSLSDMHDVQGLTDSTQNSRTELLLTPYVQSLGHLVSLQWLMHNGDSDLPKFKLHLKSLGSLILGANDVNTLDAMVDDTDVLLKQLQAVGSYGRMLDDAEIMMDSLKSAKHILAVACPNATVQFADTLTQLGSLYTRLDNSMEAEKAFAAAKQLFTEDNEKSAMKSRWAVLYTEYLATFSTTARAMDLYRQTAIELQTADMSVKESSSRQRLERDSLVGRSACLTSQAAMRVNDLYLANRFARQAVKISSAIWQAIEKPSGCQFDQPVMCEIDPSMHNLSSELSSLTISSENAPSRSQCQGGTYWNYVDLHCTALQNMTHVSMYNGLYQDAVNYAEQLRRVANTIHSPVRIARATALSALVYAKAGEHNQATGLLSDCELSRHRLVYLEDHQAALWSVEAFIETGDYPQAESLLDLLETPRLATDGPNTVAQLIEVGIKKAPVRGRAKTARPIKNPAKRPGKPSPAEVQEGIVDSRLSRSQGYVVGKCRILRARIALLQRESPVDLSSSHNTGPVYHTLEGSTMTAMSMFRKALHELASDSVKCVLSETAVALPVKYKSARKSGRVSFVQADQAPVAAKVPKHNRTRGTTTKAVKSSTALSTGEQLVIDAQSLLHGIENRQKDACSSDTLHLAYKVQSQLTLLSSTINAPFSMSSLEIVLQSLVPKNVVQNREQLTVDAERATREKSQVLAWPDVSTLNTSGISRDSLDHTVAELADLPETWSIVSMSLAENQQEILMSKVMAKRSPFILRIPLSRSDLEIEEGNELTFDQAKEELLQIIAEANASAHDKRGSGDIELRKEWYAEREQLDQRLGDWLYNIENMWLGGFRGLMCSKNFDDSVVIKFGQSLNKTLDQHLPSRQKPGIVLTKKTVLHAHVIELFLGLGDPDQQELDDAVTDLLYFVIDILQFSGEHNAYDEIDFDSMLMEVLDALRSCYDAILPNQSGQHTILIVDKELASFPWESLPCLQTQSVSRMPSLDSILQRLKKIRTQSPTSQGYIIPADQGSYMLNPSSDLISTQSTFQPILQSQLSTFHSSINQAPTESSFTSLLTTNPLLLYFGHGSGAQYIRGRAIRNLDTCAVTLLMGCSSAKMTEAGKFESYGMPGYYIGGKSGCMAVVGTLWDVTDRDIDRFALKTLVEWGLLDQDELVNKALERSHRNMARKGKNLRNGDVARRGDVSLDQAVSLGREACLLRYLNGAAPVVYGVPVYLK